MDREKRKTEERIDSEINNKRSYARTKLLELMFANEPYGKFIYGTHDEVEQIDEASAYFAWKRLLENSYIQLNVIGNQLPEGLFESVTEHLSSFDRSMLETPLPTNPIIPSETVNHFTEHMDITQGKLVMGFSSEISGSLKKSLSLMLSTDIFGGGPYSRLFTNVREKQSLCYYCSASQRRSKGFVIVDCGVDGENAVQAEKAILAELDELKKGNIEDFRIEASKKSVIDSLLSYNDSAAALDMWYSMDIEDKNFMTPEDAVELIRNVSKDSIVTALKGIKLHSVYKLLPNKENRN